jgi:FkbM family methyltransferase
MFTSQREKKMIKNLKAGIVSLVDRLGYEIRQKKPAPPLREMTHLESCLHLLTNMRQTLNIVQVGANDGITNDPLYEFISNYPHSTRIILCEPQSYLIPELEKSYGFHDAKYIFNGAIGPGPSLKLYRIKRECWAECSAPYAKEWPEYRAPTGVTSSSYDHVSAWVSKYYRGDKQREDVIEDVSVECVNICELLKRAALFESIDVLQVDAEGFDDQVVYASNIGEFLPLVVNFEYGNLPWQRAQDLRNYLTQKGYVFSQHGIDGLAIRTSRAN